MIQPVSPKALDSSAKMRIIEMWMHKITQKDRLKIIVLHLLMIHPTITIKRYKKYRNNLKNNFSLRLNK